MLVLPPFSLFVSLVHFEKQKRERKKIIIMWRKLTFDISQKTEFLFETINWNYELVTCFMVLTACYFDVARFIFVLHFGYPSKMCQFPSGRFPK